MGSISSLGSWSARSSGCDMEVKCTAEWWATTKDVSPSRPNVFSRHPEQNNIATSNRANKEYKSIIIEFSHNVVVSSKLCLLGGLRRRLGIPLLAFLPAPTLDAAQHLLDPVIGRIRDLADLGVGTVERDRVPDHEVQVSFKGLYRVVLVVIQLRPNRSKVSRVLFGNDLEIRRNAQEYRVDGLSEDKGTSSKKR